MRKKEGFTLIELLIVIGIIAVLMSIAIVAINPGRQFAKANNAKRWGDANAIASAISMNIIENKGIFTGTCETTIPAGPTIIADDVAKTDATKTDICTCIVDSYLGSMPYDPTTTGASYTACDDYNTGYTISKSAAGRITIKAPDCQTEGGSCPVEVSR